MRGPATGIPLWRAPGTARPLRSRRREGGAPRRRGWEARRGSHVGVPHRRTRPGRRRRGGPGDPTVRGRRRAAADRAAGPAWDRHRRAQLPGTAAADALLRPDRPHGAGRDGVRRDDRPEPGALRHHRHRRRPRGPTGRARRREVVARRRLLRHLRRPAVCGGASRPRRPTGPRLGRADDRLRPAADRRLPRGRPGPAGGVRHRQLRRRPGGGAQRDGPPVARPLAGAPRSRDRDVGRRPDVRWADPRAVPGGGRPGPGGPVVRRDVAGSGHHRRRQPEPGPPREHALPRPRLPVGRRRHRPGHPRGDRRGEGGRPARRPAVPVRRDRRTGQRRGRDLPGLADDPGRVVDGGRPGRRRGTGHVRAADPDPRRRPRRLDTRWCGRRPPPPRCREAGSSWCPAPATRSSPAAGRSAAPRRPPSCSPPERTGRER